MFAVFREESSLEDKKSPWGTLFDVEDPRSKVPQCKGKFLDVYQVLEVARYDIQYCDWRARQDLLTIMLLHEKVFFKSPSDILLCEPLVVVLCLYKLYYLLLDLFFELLILFLVIFDKKICIL